MGWSISYGVTNTKVDYYEMVNIIQGDKQMVDYCDIVHIIQGDKQIDYYENCIIPDHTKIAYYDEIVHLI